MHRLVFRLAKFMAILGGLVLVLLICITCLSVLGRMANTLGHSDFIKDNLSFLSAGLTGLGPIKGDFELVEAGVAFAIVAFLPWCQLNRAHANVELFTVFLSDRVNRFLSFLWEVIFALALVLIAWRLYVGTTDKIRYGETTFLLQFPVWWGFALCTAAAVVAGFVAIYSAWLHGRELVAGESLMPLDRGAGH